MPGMPGCHLCRMLTLRNRPPLPPSGLPYNAEDPCHLTMKAASHPDDHAACTGLWILTHEIGNVSAGQVCNTTRVRAFVTLSGVTDTVISHEDWLRASLHPR